ncbi:hypothetical protein NMS_2208 [Nonlabens marinus S1-08]|uniref:Uncharacterized protein n=1 Tax=Nonlabens marinus S1-08 TaxID=1454201 RepID=W8VXN1_9FLAO|nr:hypothetical protein NMS_2208 [Nonlabens marinus S1-08]
MSHATTGTSYKCIFTLYINHVNSFNVCDVFAFAKANLLLLHLYSNEAEA